MLHMIFQYGGEAVLIQRILIGFEAILEKDIPITTNYYNDLYTIYFYELIDQRKI